MAATSKRDLTEALFHERHGETLLEWVLRRKLEEGDSWRELAGRLLVDDEISVTNVTLHAWYGAAVKDAEAVAA